MKLIIPKKENLIPLNFEYIDRTIDQYYCWSTRFLMRERLYGVLRLLDKKRVQRILDAGYGGGTFMPTLAQIADDVYGIDLHDKKQIVNKILKKEGVGVKLYQGSILKLPFKNNFFDTIVCLSVLEHFKDDELDYGIRELYRVVKPGGSLIIGIPGKNPLSNFFIKYILVCTPNEIHPSGHLDILRAVENVKKPDKISWIPGFLPKSWAGFLYIKIKK